MSRRSVCRRWACRDRDFTPCTANIVFRDIRRAWRSANPISLLPFPGAARSCGPWRGVSSVAHLRRPRGQARGESTNDETGNSFRHFFIRISSLIRLSGFVIRRVAPPPFQTGVAFITLQSPAVFPSEEDRRLGPRSDQRTARHAGSAALCGPFAASARRSAKYYGPYSAAGVPADPINFRYHPWNEV